MTTTDTRADQSTDDAPELFYGYNHNQSVIVAYTVYGFAWLHLTDAAYRLTEASLTRAIVEVAAVAHQRAMAHFREFALGRGIPARHLNERGLPTAETVDDMQRRINEDADF